MDKYMEDFMAMGCSDIHACTFQQQQNFSQQTTTTSFKSFNYFHYLFQLFKSFIIKENTFNKIPF